MSANREIFNEIVEIITSLLSPSGTARSLLREAFGPHTLIDDIDLNGASRWVATNIVNDLLKYEGTINGKRPLEVLMQYIKDSGIVGVERQERIATLLPDIATLKPVIFVRWWRWVIAALIVLLAVGGGWILWDRRPVEVPNLGNFSRHSAVTPNITVTALTRLDEYIYMGLQEGTAGNETYHLARLRWADGKSATLQNVTTLRFRIREMIPDCAGNLIISQPPGLTPHPEGGIVLMNPDAPQNRLIINPEMYPEHIRKYTNSAFAVRCKANQTYVWTTNDEQLLVAFHYPTGLLVPPLTITFDPTDFAIRQVQEAGLVAVGSTLYQTDNASLDVLWVAGQGSNYQAKTIAISFSGVNAHPIPEGSLMYFRLGMAPRGEVWAASKTQLASGQQSLDYGAPINGGVQAIIPDVAWVWLGVDCANSTPPCYPLLVRPYRGGEAVQVAYPSVKHIYGLLRDPNGAIWIGSDSGLHAYPTQ